MSESNDQTSGQTPAEAASILRRDWDRLSPEEALARKLEIRAADATTANKSRIKSRTSHGEAKIVQPRSEADIERFIERLKKLAIPMKGSTRLDETSALLVFWEVKKRGKKLEATEREETVTALQNLIDNDPKLSKTKFAYFEVVESDEPNASRFKTVLTRELKKYPDLQIIVLSAHAQTMGIAPSSRANRKSTLSYEELAMALSEGVQEPFPNIHFVWGHCRAMGGVTGLEEFLPKGIKWVSGFTGQPTHQQVGKLIADVLDVARECHGVISKAVHNPMTEEQKALEAAVCECENIVKNRLVRRVSKDKKAGEIILRTRNQKKWVTTGPDTLPGQS